jgi:GNAT superfamily N-acetyltransferase
MYFDYLKEMQGVETLTKEHGFVTYQIQNKECFIKDWYVKPEYRGKVLAMRMIKEVEKLALEKCCDAITANVDIGTSRTDENTLILIRYGCKIMTASKYSIFFMKRLGV